MPFGVWGASSEFYFRLPEGVASYVLLAFYTFLNLVLLVRSYRGLSRMSTWQWAGLAA
ncbi:MAG: hypothetical protein R3C44_18975 [Chloroflexota bacterium]